MVSNAQPNAGYKKFSDAVRRLRTRLDMSHKQLAIKLGMQSDVTVKAWEDGRHLGGKRYLTRLEHVCLSHNWSDLAHEFAELKRCRLDLTGTVTTVPDVNLSRTGRESALGEVLHLIDERCAEIRGDHKMFDSFTKSGMSISDIVAHEMDMLKGSIRALPVVIPVLRSHAKTA